MSEFFQVLPAIGGGAAAVAMLAYGIREGLRKARANAVAVESGLRDRIEAEQQERLRVEREAGEAWRRLAEGQREQIRQLQGELRNVRKRLEHMQQEHTRVLRLNLDLQGTVSGLEKRVRELEILVPGASPPPEPPR